jgi:hypothetical protein
LFGPVLIKTGKVELLHMSLAVNRRRRKQQTEINAKNSNGTSVSITNTLIAIADTSNRP